MRKNPRILPAWVAICGAISVGALTAMQARVNGQLGVALDDGFVAAFISFGSGFVILIVLSALFPAGRGGVRRLVDGVRAATIPWWMLLGGAAGAFAVATQGLSVGIIGVGLFTVGMVAGQTVNGLVLDRTGYGPGGVVAVTMPRVIGAAIALVAVGSVFVGDTVQGIPVWMLILPFFAGAGIAWQQATNGRLRQQVGTPLTATLVNFAGGTTFLAVAAVIDVAIVGMPEALPAEAWIYAGGALGVVYIFLSAALVQHTGVLLLGLGSVVGLLVTAVILDAIWPTASSPPLLTQIVIVAIALLSVAVAAAPWRLRRP
ncbi:DMT family transporter [Microbacterium marmarense]|uniref:DMT family transporter n=1 Tax=Microbacterium marmarense TaxID=3122051 RepID=A0ABU8LTK8_9MICO